MSYLYDAYFSYKRDRESDNWHEKVKAKLEFWLKLELERANVRIFFDTEEIRAGMRFHQKLASALKQSRCIICIWSPLYFQSKWCYSEWRTFVHRSEITNRDLVVPASFHDGESFPHAAKQMQFVDFSPFANTMDAFWQSSRAVDFDPVLRTFAKDLAGMIKNAPPYDENFPVVEVADEQVNPEQVIRRPASG